MKIFLNENQYKTLFENSATKTKLKGLKPMGVYMKAAFDSGYDEESMAKMQINKFLNRLTNLPEIVTLYRVVFVEDESKIDHINIGEHYGVNERNLLASHYRQSHVGGGNPFLLTVKADRNLVNFHETLLNNIIYPHENEITLKNNGRGANIVKIKPL